MDVASLELAAGRAMASGDARAAQDLLRRAVEQAPDRADLWLSLAACRRRLGDVEGAMAAVERALVVEPRAFPALLMRASLLERAGRTGEAGVAYGAALTQAPLSLEVLNEPMRKATLHAREAYAAHQARLAAAIRHDASAALDRCAPAERRRLEAFIGDFLGERKRYRQEPSAFYYPGLGAREFHDRESFPWLPALEAATGDIAGELEQILAEDAGGFVPYVDYDDSLPLDQWRSLNRSPDWSAFHIFFNGAPVEANAARCPKTVEILSRLPQPQLPGRSPAAMFSVLKPRTHIPPHTGVSNTRLVTHLPLIVPPGCRFRVGAETRSWEKGRAWVFDDTIEHEAFNDSDEVRIILILDIAQPALSPAEHAAVAALTQALDRFGGAPAPASI